MDYEKFNKIFLRIWIIAAIIGLGLVVLGVWGIVEFIQFLHRH